MGLARRAAEPLRIQADGVGLHVAVEGPEDRVPAVFLHGVGSSGRTWEWLPDTVTRGRRTVRIDLRGHARSDHAPGTYDLARYGTDVVTVLRDLVVRPALLMGHSLGGVVAWWLAQSHPELVGAALLEDPPLLAGETPDVEAGRFRDVFHVVKATILLGKERGMDDETAFRWLRRESMRRRITIERVAEELVAAAPEERPPQARTS